MTEWLQVCIRFFIMLHRYTGDLQPVFCHQQYFVTIKSRQHFGRQHGHIGRQVAPSSQKFCIPLAKKQEKRKKTKMVYAAGGAWPRDGLPLFSFVLRHLCRFTVFYLATKRSVKNARCLSSCCQNQPTVIWPASVLMYAIAGIQTFPLRHSPPPGYHCLNFKKTPQSHQKLEIGSVRGRVNIRDRVNRFLV